MTPVPARWVERPALTRYDLEHYFAGEYQHGTPLTWPERSGEGMCSAPSSMVAAMLAHLPKHERQAVQTVDVDQVPPIEAARRLGITERTLQRYRAAGLDRLAMVLLKEAEPRGKPMHPS